MLHIFYWLISLMRLLGYVIFINLIKNKTNLTISVNLQLRLKSLHWKKKNQSFLLQCHQDKTYCWVNEGSMNYKMRNNCSISAKVSVCWKFIVNKNSLIKQSTNARMSFHNTSTPLAMKKSWWRSQSWSFLQLLVMKYGTSSFH